MKDYRHLTQAETDMLKANGCWAENWQNVYVAENFTPEYVVRVNFYGIVCLGSFSSMMPLPGGISVPCGVYDATLFNVTVGDCSLIANVHGYIANYSIGPRTYIADVGKIYMEGVSAFGNGMKVNVLNETGGRAVTVYDGMSAQVAYLSAMYRHRPEAVRRLDAMAMALADRIKSDKGVIGSNVRIENVGIIRNVRIGDNATVQGCLRLFDGTVASTPEDPVIMGSGIVCTDFIVQPGAVVEDCAQISRTFVGQGVRLGRGFSCSDSLFFANSHCENGEAVSVFAGPYTVSHHKSTLLIGSMYSFMNAGSASNFSNHRYKLGPVHQGIFARGVKFGSGAYMMLPVKVAPFTTVLGHHVANIDTSAMPFSYLVECESGSRLIPGVNLKSSGLFRDMLKWPERDRRSENGRTDRVLYHVLSPYTASGMLDGRNQLLKMIPHERLFRAPSESSYGGCTVSVPSIAKGAGLYDAALKFYMGKRIVDRLTDRRLNTDEALQAAMPPESAVGEGKWVDVAGLLAPKAEIDGLLDALEQGQFETFSSMEKVFSGMASNYGIYEWKWVYDHIFAVYGIMPDTITRKELVGILRKWNAVAETIFSELERDAAKEYSGEVRTGFGVDGDNADAETDFLNVRGSFSDNALVQKIRSVKADVCHKVTDIISLL